MSTDTTPSIRIINGALDELQGGVIVLRGVISPDQLDFLLVDRYQRDALNNKKVRGLVAAFKAGKPVPDIALGMRGERYTNRNGVHYLQDPIYIIDGLQRRTAALRAMAEVSDLQPHLGATVYFGTNMTIERELFEALNLGQTPLSGSVHLRNQGDSNPAVSVIISLTEGNKQFPLYKRVSWKQNMTRADLMNGTTYAKVIGALHSHAGPGRSSAVLELAAGLQKIMATVGKAVFVDNIIRYFEVVDSAWGFERVTFNDTASYTKANFLTQLALLFSAHENFWDEKGLLKIDRRVVTKLSTFPIADPTVVQLASGTGTSGVLLYHMFKEHIDKGTRTGRLVERKSVSTRSRNRHRRSSAATEEVAG